MYISDLKHLANVHRLTLLPVEDHRRKFHVLTGFTSVWQAVCFARDYEFHLTIVEAKVFSDVNSTHYAYTSSSSEVTAAKFQKMLSGTEDCCKEGTCIWRESPLYEPGYNYFLGVYDSKEGRE